MNFIPMLAKELKELARSYKLLFVPLAFVLLGLSQPITYKLLPSLMENGANLPPGTVIEIPVPPPSVVVASTIGQFNQVGILVLVLVIMSAVAGERASGVAATVLTKPVGRGEYLAAKGVSYGLLSAISLLLATGLAGYYTQVLFGDVNWANLLTGTLAYLPNLLLVVAVTLLCSSFMATPVAAGGTALAAVILLNNVPKYLGTFAASIYPGALTKAAGAMMSGESYALARPLTGVLALTALAFAAGWAVLRRQEI